MAIESPCAEICKFDRKADLCVGCFRTTDTGKPDVTLCHIALWGNRFLLVSR